MLKEEKKKLNEKKPGIITCQESKKKVPQFKIS